MPETAMEVLQIPSELEPMVALYRDRKPKRVLEIGCWDGGTLKVWLEEGRADHVLAIDPNHRNEDAYVDWVKSPTSLVLGFGFSQDAEMVDLVRLHGPYDWAFIDGDHSNEGVRSDVDVCLPLVRNGGLLLLHDITPEIGLSTYPPGDVLRELAAEGYETWEYVDPEPQRWAHGIGVIQVGEVV